MKRLLLALTLFSINAFAYEITYKETLSGTSRTSCEEANRDLKNKIDSLEAAITSKIKSVEFGRCKDLALTRYTQEATDVLKTKSLEGIY